MSATCRKTLAIGLKSRDRPVGLHLVAEFPSVIFTEKVVKDLYKRGIKVVPVESYPLCREGTHTHKVLLGYSHLSKEDVPRGVSILRDELLATSRRRS